MKKKTRSLPKLSNLSDLTQLKQTLALQAAAQAAAAEQERVRLAKIAAEANLFKASLGDVKPLPTNNRRTPSLSPALPLPHKTHADKQAVLHESLTDELDVTHLLDSDENLSFKQAHVGIDVLRKLRRGEWVIQAQIDLHGLRSDEARDALGAFIRDCVRREVRCVRVIHGKGLGSVNKEPVLKRKVLSWLSQKSEVLAFCLARPADGGAGALIVLLQKA